MSQRQANITYNKKGLIIVIQYGDIKYTYDYDQKGMIHKLSPVFINSKKDNVYLKNHYNKQGLLVNSMIRRYQYAYEHIPKTPILQVSYKTIHVASSQMKKIKAQQQWLLRNVNDYSYFNI